MVKLQLKASEESRMLCEFIKRNWNQILNFNFMHILDYFYITCVLFFRNEYFVVIDKMVIK